MREIRPSGSGEGAVPSRPYLIRLDRTPCQRPALIKSQRDHVRNHSFIPPEHLQRALLAFDIERPEVFLR